MTQSATLRGLLLALCLPVASAAQGPYTVHSLAEGVYAVVRGPYPISDSNVLFVVNDQDVVVVDANIFPSSAREVIAEIRKVTTKPVRYVINTHWHSDHHYGNAVYREAYPGVEFVQHPDTRRDIIARDIPALATNLATTYPEQIAAIQRALDRGVTSQGVTVTPDQRTRFMELKRIYETFLRDMKDAPVVPGTLTITDSLILHRGDRRIEIRYLGRGNTTGDLVVYLPKEKVLATGDLVVSPMPFSFFSYLGEWPSTLRALKRFDATTIIPGHGELQHDWTYIDQLASMIESTWQQVTRAVNAGADLETTRRQVDIDRFRRAFIGADSTKRATFDRLYTNPAIEAAFAELRPDSAAADSGFVVQQVALNAYAVVRREPQGVINESNSLFMVGDTGVVVVDAQSSSARTRQTLAAIRAITDRPVRTVINTHWHDDHVTGNAVYRDAFPGVQFIGHESFAEDMTTLGVQFRTSGVAARDGTIGFLRGLVDQKKSYLGGPISDEETRSHQLSAWLLYDYSNASADFLPVMPTRTLSDHLELQLGNRRIQVLHPGRGHTRGDLVVFLPDEKVLAAGDLVMWPVPFVGSTSFPADFAVTLERLRELRPSRVVPGHGRVLEGGEADAHMATTARMLRFIAEGARTAVARGDSLPQAKAAIRLDEFRTLIAGDSPVRRILFNYYIESSAIPLAFEQERAKGTGRPSP